MITSCNECQTKCCKTGPGPIFIPIPKEQYLANFESYKNYQKQCAEYDVVKGTCGIWDSTYLPDDCRNYVCHVRQYSPGELEVISERNKV